MNRYPNIMLMFSRKYIFSHSFGPRFSNNLKSNLNSWFQTSNNRFLPNSLLHIHTDTITSSRLRYVRHTCVLSFGLVHIHVHCRKMQGKGRHSFQAIFLKGGKKSIITRPPLNITSPPFPRNFSLRR